MNTAEINAAEINAAASVLPVPALPAIRLPRPIVWLLDVDLGGAPLRYATAEITIPSRADDGAGRLYFRGLPDLEQALGSESLTVTLPLPDAAARHVQVRQFVGRPFVLRAYRGEPVLEDATVLLQGITTAASYLDPGAPDSVTLALRRGTETLSSTVVAASEQVDAATWLPTVVRVAPPALGAAYPVVIGCPGRPDPDDPLHDSYAAVPALQVDTSPGGRILLVARGHVAATQAWLHDLSEDGGSPELRTLIAAYDDIGQPCTTMSLVGAFKDPPDASRLYTGWTPATGAGVAFEGRAVRGLGTLLLWGSRLYSRAVIDVGAMRSVQAALDVYEIDAVINDPDVTWDEWVSSNLLEMYGIDRVEGPRGVWYREARYTPDPAQVRATLTTSASAPGWQVTRATGYSESTDDACSEISVTYAPSGSGGAGTRRVTLASARNADDPNRTRVDAACRRSREILGRVERTWQLGTTGHTPTAWAVARRLAERHALPASYVELAGGPDLADLSPYDTVTVDDHDLPAPVLGVVQPDIRLSETGVTVTVRIPGR